MRSARRELASDVAAMLDRNSIAGAEVPFEHDGYSGCRMSRIESGGRSYVIKRTRFADDWMIQMTSDLAVREARIAVSDVLAPLRRVRSPSIDAAHDGDGFALLMHDVAPYLVPTDRRLTPDLANHLLAAAAELHACYWQALPEEDLGWCGMRERLLMLSPQVGQRMVAAGFDDIGFVRGWERFHAWAPGDVSDLIRRLHDDPSNLVATLASLPQTLLHNDIKAANCAVEGDTLWLFDWALAGTGPVCAEIAWMMGVNVELLPWTLDESLERYAGLLKQSLGDRRFQEARWDEQYDLSRLMRLMLLGWAKVPRGDSHDSGELRWLCEGALAAARRHGL